MENRLLKEVDYESAGRPFESGWARHKPSRVCGCPEPYVVQGSQWFQYIKHIHPEIDKIVKSVKQGLISYKKFNFVIRLIKTPCPPRQSGAGHVPADILEHYV